MRKFIAKENYNGSFMKIVKGDIFTLNNEQDKWLMHKNGKVICQYGSPTYHTYFEEIKSFTKSDLRNGDRLTYANGEVRYFINNVLLIYNCHGFSQSGTMSDYTTDLKVVFSSFSSLNIEKVERQNQNGEYEVIWVREEKPEPKKIKMSDVFQILKDKFNGEVEIVED